MEAAEWNPGPHYSFAPRLCGLGQVTADLSGFSQQGSNLGNLRWRLRDGGGHQGVTLRFQPSDAPHGDSACPARLYGLREPRDGAVGPCREPGTAHGACAACRATGGRPDVAQPRPRAPSAAVPPAACGVAARQSGRLGACRALPRAGAPTGPRSPGRRGCKPAVAPSPRPDPPSDALLREIFLCCFAFVSLVWRQQEGRGLVDSRRWPDHRGRGVTLGAAGPYRGLRCAPMLATFATFAFEQMRMLPCKIQKA